MSDQSAAANTRKSQEDLHAEIVAAVDKAKTLGDEPSVEQQMATTLLDKALTLKVDREKNTRQTGANRDMLRGMAAQELITAEQAAAVEALYPAPKRRETTPDAPPAPPAPAPDTPPASDVTPPAGNRTSGRRPAV